MATVIATAGADIYENEPGAHRRLGQMPKFNTFYRTMRRHDAECSINLSKWRAWFDEGADTPDDKPGSNQPSGQDDQVSLDQLPEQVQSYIKKLRDESASYRIKFQEVNQRLDALTDAQKKKLETDGNYQELLKQTEAELADLRPRADRAKALEDVIRESNNARIATLPEAKRGLVPVDYPPEKLQTWLNTNYAQLTAPPAPEFDGGAGAGSNGNGGSATPKLTPDELRLAMASGMTPEQYAAAKTATAPSE